MTDFLLSSAVAPFTLALAVLFGLLTLELVFALLGGSLMAGETGAPELDGPDVDGPDIDMPELDAGFDAVELDMLDGLDADALEGLEGFGAPDAETGLDAAPPVSFVSSWLGLGKAPFMVWLAAALTGFGIIGLALQSVCDAALGMVLPGWLAALPALAGGWAGARGFSGLFARLIPSTETQAVSETRLGRRRGLVTQGTAARGRPAEVRVADRHGNSHYLRAEPFEDSATIPQGSTVLVMRDPRSGHYRLIALD